MEKIKNERFNLIEFGSIKHTILLLNAKFIVSSHLITYIATYFQDSYYAQFIKYKYIFLQHGIIKSDLSTCINSVPELKLFITCTNEEYNDSALTSKYIFSEQEVVNTGLARHDKLINLQQNYIKNTEKKYILEFILFPHQNVQEYFKKLQLPNITYYDKDTINLQELFVKIDLYITDYSSVACDIALLKKNILYYQFDCDDIENHQPQGYFDYTRDGFGPVVDNQIDLFTQIKEIIKRNFELDPIYKARMENTMIHNDGKCSERIYTF